MENLFHGRRWYLERHQVTITSNAGSKVVYFESAFTKIPSYLIILPDGADGSTSTSSCTTSALTINIASETVYDGVTIDVYVFIMEKP